MDDNAARALLQRVADGLLQPEQALAELAQAPFRDVSVALVDHHRALRQGIAEVVWGEGKSAETLAILLRELAGRGAALVTRVDADKAREVQARAPELGLVYDAIARTLRVPGEVKDAPPGRVCVLTAGTSDEPVARECCEALAAFGVAHERLIDVGVAGLHRLLAKLDALRAADVLIVIAGMEGALPSVVGGLVSAPVIAVPTSVGYGAGASGFAALAGMLTSCASGITVCNIDNGFGAAFAARRILATAATLARRT